MFFVSRWRESSSLSKRVIRLPDATVLDWFRRGWEQDDPEEWIEAELNGRVYGLDSRLGPRPGAAPHQAIQVVADPSGVRAQPLPLVGGSSASGSQSSLPGSTDPTYSETSRQIEHQDMPTHRS
jgi:hypothetical protein